MNPDFDLPAFLLGKLYDNMDWDNGWTLSDAIALAEDIRRYDGIDCDPQEIYEIMQEFHEQDAGGRRLTRLTMAGRGPSRNALRQLAGARRGKPAGAMLLNTMGGYHHEVHSYLQRFHTGYGP